MREVPVLQGDSRPCLLGFVDDLDNPDEGSRQAASERALGVCQLGSQLCSPNGTWQSCEGEVRPQRDPETGYLSNLRLSVTALTMTVMVSSTTRFTLTLMVMDLRAAVLVV